MKKKGIYLNGYSDTEVLLKGFIEYGENILKKLNGIFAFAIWNDKKQELFMARDHFGIKPFFYTIVDEELVFGSEIKVLLEHPKVDATIDKEGLMELFGLRTMSYTWTWNF